MVGSAFGQNLDVAQANNQALLTFRHFSIVLHHDDHKIQFKDTQMLSTNIKLFCMPALLLRSTNTPIVPTRKKSKNHNKILPKSRINQDWLYCYAREL